MEKSNTLDRQVIEQAIKEAVNSVKRFTKKELYQLIKTSRTSKKPYIIPVGDLGYIAGEYAIKEYNSVWYLVNIYNITDEIAFSNRQTAILYAIALTKKQYYLANSLLNYDQDITRLEQEIKLYTLRSRRALKQKRLSDYNIYIGRLTELQYLLKHRQRLITKSLKMAKYNYL